NWTNLHGEHLQQTGLIHAPQGADAASHNLITDNSPRFRIIYPGNLGKPHPVGVIIRAAELLREHKEIEFLFVGDEHANSRLSQEREKRELENIKFIPFQPAGHFQTILESADLHLVTLRPKLDGYLVPCKFYASLAVGRPVIFLGPKESEIGQVIKEYGCGEIIEEMKAEKLADAILKYRHEGDVWFSAQEGSQKAAEVYQPMKSLSQWTSLLEQKASL
ncbi:MAG: glycosyltransferase, partial [Pseudomonadota bacterium]